MQSRARGGRPPACAPADADRTPPDWGEDARDSGPRGKWVGSAGREAAPCGGAPLRDCAGGLQRRGAGREGSDEAVGAERADSAPRERRGAVIYKTKGGRLQVYYQVGVIQVV